MVFAMSHYGMGRVVSIIKGYKIRDGFALLDSLTEVNSLLFSLYSTTTTTTNNNNNTKLIS